MYFFIVLIWFTFNALFWNKSLLSSIFTVPFNPFTSIDIGVFSFSEVAIMSMSVFMLLLFSVIFLFVCIFCRFKYSF